jgi:hypothetical protein
MQVCAVIPESLDTRQHAAEQKSGESPRSANPHRGYKRMNADFEVTERDKSLSFVADLPAKKTLCPGGALA